MTQQPEPMTPERLVELIATFQSAGRGQYHFMRVELARHEWAQLAAELSAHIRPAASAAGDNPLISLPEIGRRDWIRTNGVSDSRGSEGEKANGTD